MAPEIHIYAICVKYLTGAVGHIYQIFDELIQKTYMYYMFHIQVTGTNRATKSTVQIFDTHTWGCMCVHVPYLKYGTRSTVHRKH